MNVGFFRASAPVGGAPGFEGAVRAYSQTAVARERERDLGQGVVVRLERYAEGGDFLEGEFSRVQTANIPSQASSEGLLPLVLADGHGLAHVSAFMYHKPTRVLALQRNSQSTTIGRLSIYIAADDPGNLVTFAPLLTENAMDRFRHGVPRSFSVKFAGIDQLAALDDANVAVARGARMIAEAYDGVDVEIRVTAGRTRRGVLGRARTVPEVERLAGLPGVEDLKARLSGDATAVDLLEEHMKDVRVLELPEGDPASHYAIRKAFLREVFTAKLQEVRERFAP